MSTKKHQYSNKSYKPYKSTSTYKKYTSYLSYNSFKCKKCDINYSSQNSLDKHAYIHVNPIYCYFPNCEKVFSPKHSYQYSQHIDSHNGGLHIKCKFCEHISKSLSSNTLHMKLHHRMEYSSYMKNINKYNEDIKTIDITKITKLTHLTTNWMEPLYTEDEQEQNFLNPAHKDVYEDVYDSSIRR